MTLLTEKVKFMRNIPLFKGLTDPQIERLTQRVVERDYKAGDVVKGKICGIVDYGAVIKFDKDYF